MELMTIFVSTTAHFPPTKSLNFTMVVTVHKNSL